MFINCNQYKTIKKTNVKSISLIYYFITHLFLIDNVINTILNISNVTNY